MNQWEAEVDETKSDSESDADLIPPEQETTQEPHIDLGPRDHTQDQERPLPATPEEIPAQGRVPPDASAPPEIPSDSDPAPAASANEPEHTPTSQSAGPLSTG